MYLIGIAGGSVLLLGLGFQGLHIGVREAEMVADLVNQDVTHQMGEVIAGLEKRYHRQHANRQEALRRRR